MRRLGALALLVPLFLAAAPMETNQLVDGQGLPLATDANPLVTRGATAPSAAAAFGIAPTVTRGATVMTAKGSAGNLYGFSFTQGGTAGLFAIIDAAAAPTAGAAIAPVECIAVPASGYVARRQDIPDRYVAGIQIVSTSSCATYTANAPVQMSASVQ